MSSPSAPCLSGIPSLKVTSSVKNAGFAFFIGAYSLSPPNAVIFGEISKELYIFWYSSQRKFFNYYLSPTDVLIFDADDLFYYSNHSIMRRGNQFDIIFFKLFRYVFCMQYIGCLYSNIEVLNPYHGVSHIAGHKATPYLAKIHLHGDYIIGRYATPIEAAIDCVKTVFGKDCFSRIS